MHTILVCSPSPAKVHCDVARLVVKMQRMCLQGQAICHSFCGREWSREEHKFGKDCILAGSEQDEGMLLFCFIVCMSTCQTKLTAQS